MAAEAITRWRVDLRGDHVMVEDAVRAALAGARPSLEELLSLWPFGRRDAVVLRATLGTDGAVSVGANLRERVLESEPSDLARGVRQIRGDVPVVLELAGVGWVVVPLRSLI
jgi:hypothetical protein